MERFRDSLTKIVLVQRSSRFPKARTEEEDEAIGWDDLGIDINQPFLKLLPLSLMFQKVIITL